MMFKKPSTQPVALEPGQLTPQTPAEFVARGWLYYGRGDNGQAAADYREALKQNENDPETLYALGMALAASSNPQDAVQVFEQALQHLDSIEDAVRVRMLTRLIKGHINRIKTGDWHLTK
ncbi:MAG TPA: tetratricopeptide repeat protein [Anaerolinea sp.]|nr:tetratricopeptide repeat protein [Anaerolinea sp.]